MKPSVFRRFSALCFSWAFLMTFDARANEPDGEDFEQRGFLFQLDEAYLQDAGDLRFEAGIETSFDPSASVFELAAEYGLTDRVTISAALPIIDDTGSEGIGDVGLGIDYGVLKENGNRTPDVTLGFGASAPTGDADDDLGTGGWGYQIALRSSKHFAPDFHGHMVSAYQWAPGGGDNADALTGWAFGLGATWRPLALLSFAAEYLRETEREQVTGIKSRTTEEFVSAGLIFELADDVYVGAAGAAGLNDDSADTRLISKLTIEW